MTIVTRVAVALLPLLLGLPPTRAQVPAFDVCVAAVEHAADTLENYQVSRLRETFGRVGHNSHELNPNVDAQRLVNGPHWEEALREKGDQAYLKYGKGTWDSWSQAAEYARTHVHDPLTPDLLQRINHVAMENLPFPGYEGRRVRKAFNEGKITKEQMKNILDGVYNRNENPSGVNPDTLRGKFRSDPIDDITHTGSSIDAKINRYFTPEELEAVRNNPHMRLDPKTINEHRPGVIEATSHYTAPHKVEESVNKVFDRLNRDLEHANRDIDIVRAVARMQKDMVVIHPFLDGNGRSVRLLGDLVLDRYGLPPPILISEEEITKSVNEIATDMIEGMERYAEQTRKANRAKMLTH